MAGGSVRTTGSSASRFSTSCCHACRWTSATTVAWSGNHFFTDNRAIGPQDFDTATIAAPGNPNLPERRRLSGHVRDAQLTFAARCHRQLLHLRERLRRRHDVLARRGLRRSTRARTTASRSKVEPAPVAASVTTARSPMRFPSCSSPSVPSSPTHRNRRVRCR